MSTQEFTDLAEIALAPSFRERFDFSVPEHFATFSKLTWDAAAALAKRRDELLPPITGQKTLVDKQRAALGLMGVAT